ncbi:MAG: hypothetical protein WCJ47_09460 [Methanomicrobiales archaeon]
MNTHQANIAIPAADPDATGTAARAIFGILPVSPVERFSGIRSYGQYCRQSELTRTGTPVTASRIIRRRTAVHGMCP